MIVRGVRRLSTVRVDGSGGRVRAGRVVSCGPGFLGCTGHDSRADVTTLQPLPTLADIRGVSVAAGWGHSGIVTEAGEALVVGRTFEFGNTMRLINYSRGMSWFAKVVNGVADAFRDTPLTPRLVEVDNDVAVPVFQSIVCSPGPLTVILSADGRVFCLGTNEHGQCGIGKMSPAVFRVRPVEGLAAETVVAVAAGLTHVLAVTASGALYSWGSNNRGQLGLFHRDGKPAPSRVVGKGMTLTERRVVTAACGLAHSACVTDDGAAWVWGKMQSVDASSTHEKMMADELQPRQVSIPSTSPVVAVTCGQAHTCFQTADGRVWMTGLRGRGVLYDATGADVDDYTASVVDPNATLTATLLAQVVAAPVEFGSGPCLPGAVRKLTSSVHHSYALTEDGDVHFWGWRLKAVPLPLTAGSRVLDLAVGYGHTLAIVRED